MGLKLKGLQGKSAVADINVTPLIDVVLVLLIIFMVITPIIINQMAVNLPDKTEEADQEDVPEDQLLVAACMDGTFSLNRSILSLPQLKEQVNKRLKPKKSKVVFVDSHPEAPYDNVVLLMDTVRDAGAEQIGVAALKEEADFLACTPMPAAPPPDPTAAPAAPAVPPG
jgi:biopolymer transport protein TolR